MQQNGKSNTQTLDQERTLPVKAQQQFELYGMVSEAGADPNLFY